MENSSDKDAQTTDLDRNSNDSPKLKRKKFTKKERDKMKGVTETSERFGPPDTAAAPMVNVCGGNEDILYQSKVHILRND